jgi:predicted O-methyltransferase YrrM
VERSDPVAAERRASSAHGILTRETRMTRLHVPLGHFYSPIIDREELAGRANSIWRDDVVDPPGIEFNAASHLHILDHEFPRFIAEYDYPEHAKESAHLSQFFTQNSQFSWLDARALFVLLRAWRPRRIIEVGSGFSTLLMADVNRRFLDRSSEITAIEPYPRAFLRAGHIGVDTVLERRVQDVSIDFFERLEAGDLLFIDSSHVSKTGSDVNRLFLDVLPRLKCGVRVHVHDVFFPHDYPTDWVLGEGRSWNEQYLLQSFLAFNNGYRVLFGSSYAASRFPEQLRTALALPSGRIFGGGSFYMERCGTPA